MRRTDRRPTEGTRTTPAMYRKTAAPTPAMCGKPTAMTAAAPAMTAAAAATAVTATAVTATAAASAGVRFKREKDADEQHDGNAGGCRQHEPHSAAALGARRLHGRMRLDIPPRTKSF
jgi:hypothetical protein